MGLDDPLFVFPFFLAMLIIEIQLKLLKNSKHDSLTRRTGRRRKSENRRRAKTRKVGKLTNGRLRSEVRVESEIREGERKLIQGFSDDRQQSGVGAAVVGRHRL